MFNIFGKTGKFLAGIRDHCLKRNAGAETITDPGYKQIFFNKKSVVAVIAQININIFFKEIRVFCWLLHWWSNMNYL